MQNLLEWSLNLIRSKESLGWMEEYYIEWCSLIEKTLIKILNGDSLIVASDNKRGWFVEYILSNINSKDRPFIPVYRLDGLIFEPSKKESIEDMLAISFPNGYLFWYIGKKTYPELLKSKDTLFWLIQNEQKDSLFFEDEKLDVRLIELFWLFERTIEGAIFGEFELNETI